MAGLMHKNISLSKYGYGITNNKNNNTLRINALKKALEVYNQNKVYNKVKALSIVWSRKKPSYAARAKRNLAWLNTIKIPKNFFNNQALNKNEGVNNKGRKIYKGPKGGLYVLGKTGNKIYIKK